MTTRIAKEILIFIATLFLIYGLAQASSLQLLNESRENVVPWNQGGSTVRKTYLFFQLYWWEMLNNQLTTLITGLSLARNLSAVAVLPYSPGDEGGPKKHYSLIGDFLDDKPLRSQQPILTMDDFLQTPDGMELVENSEKHHICFPKSGQEEYEKDLKVIGELCEQRVYLPLPHEDVDKSEEHCDEFPGTVHVSLDGRKRYIFLERLHFYHMCTERFLPWWYDVRMHLKPRAPYFTVVHAFLSKLASPVTVIHLRDLMDGQREREEEEIQRYARQIVDVMRRDRHTDGTLYVSYQADGINVGRVARLFDSEFDNVQRCTDIYACGSAVPHDLFNPPLNETAHEILFETRSAPGLLEMALSMESDYFIGNIHSTYSRNVALYRRMNGKPYAMVKGFNEVRRARNWDI